MIRFTRHASEKFLILRRHGVVVSKGMVMRAVTHPEIIDHSRIPLRIAQISFDKARVLRVVYRQEKDEKIVITFYPGRKSQYAKES